MSDPAPLHVEPRSPKANWLQQVAALDALGKVQRVFGTAGIPVLPVKGVVTSYVLYDDCASRTLADVDIRIPRRHFEQAIQLARTQGWKPKADNLILWNAVLDVDGFEVDIECTLGRPGFCAVTIDDLLARAESSVAPFGFEHVEPELNDHALILVINAFKDGLEPTPWALEDLRRIVIHPRFDAERLVDRARTGRVTSVLWIVARWLADDQGAGQWRSVCDRIGPEPPSRRVARVYRYVRELGWPWKVALFVTATSSDDIVRSGAGLALALAGILRRRARVWSSRAQST